MEIGPIGTIRGAICGLLGKTYQKRSQPLILDPPPATKVEGSFFDEPSCCTSRERSRVSAVTAVTFPKRLVRGELQEPEKRWRLSAPEIERMVSAGAQTMLSERAAIALALEESGLDSSHLVSVLKTAEELNAQLQSDGETASSTLGEIIERVDLHRDGIRISLELPIAEVGRVTAGRATSL